MTSLAKAIRISAIFLAAAADPSLAEDWSAQLLDRPITLAIPTVFAPVPAFSDGNAHAAIVEFVPPAETVEAWTQMLTLTAQGGMAEGGEPSDAVMAMAEQLASGYGAACPEGLGLQDLGAPALPGASAAFAAWLACDKVGDGGPSEAMVVLIFSAGDAVYTAQWAERGPQTAGPPLFDFDHWLPRFEALMTVRL